MGDLAAEHRAFAMLQWVPYSLPSKFDEQLAAQGHYTKLQRQRSDAALGQWDKDHPDAISDELMAFQELNKLGAYTQRDFYLPSKAIDEFYSRRLKDFDGKSRRLRKEAPPAQRRHKRRRRAQH